MHDVFLDSIECVHLIILIFEGGGSKLCLVSCSAGPCKVHRSQLWTESVPERERSRSPTIIQRPDANVLNSPTRPEADNIREEAFQYAPDLSQHFHPVSDFDSDFDDTADAAEVEQQHEVSTVLRPVLSDLEEDIADDVQWEHQQQQLLLHKEQHEVAAGLHQGQDDELEQEEERQHAGVFDDEDDVDIGLEFGSDHELQDFADNSEINALLASVDVDAMATPSALSTPHPDLCVSNKTRVQAYRERLTCMLSQSSKESLLDYILRMLRLKVEVDFPRTQFNEMLKTTHDVTLGDGNIAPTSLAMVRIRCMPCRCCGLRPYPGHVAVDETTVTHSVVRSRFTVGMFMVWVLKTT